MPLTIGLTGGIAAGKSEALAAFGRLGAATLSSDAVVHDLLESEPLRGRLVERWGPEVAPDGRVDRARIGEIVFADPEQLTWLESQIHPLVGERTAAWLAALPAETEVAVVEVPLLFEGGRERGLRHDRRDRHRRRRAPRARRRPRPRPGRRARGAPAHPGREGRAGRPRRRQRRLGRGSRAGAVRAAREAARDEARRPRRRRRRCARPGRRRRGRARRWSSACWSPAAPSTRRSRSSPCRCDHEDIIRQQAARKGSRRGADRGGDLLGVEVRRRRPRAPAPAG